MYLVFDSIHSACQFGLGHLEHAGLKAGIFTPEQALVPRISNSHFVIKVTEFARGGALELTFGKSRSIDIVHSAHFRFLFRYAEKIFCALVKMSHYIHKISSAMHIFSGKGKSARRSLRAICTAIMLWNFFALGSSGAAFFPNEESLPKKEPYEFNQFLEAVAQSPLAQRISKEKRIFSSGEIPKLAGMIQFRYLPLSSAKLTEDANIQIVLFAPVKSFLSLQRGTGKIQRENANLVCDGLGLFVLTNKDLLLVSEKDLTTPMSIPHYALYSLDPATAKTFTDAKNCAEIPVNLKEAFSFL